MVLCKKSGKRWGAAAQFVLQLYVCSPALAGASELSPGWHQINIGGGGFATGIDMQRDGTKLSRTNTGGGYRWDAVSGRWVQLISKTSLPPGGWSDFGTMGVSELIAAPSQTSSYFLHFGGNLFYSTNRGLAWTKARGFPADPDTSNGGPNGQAGSMGPLMAVDPQNASIVYAGSSINGSAGGLYVSSDSGRSYSQVSTSLVPATNMGSGFVAVAFDPASEIKDGKTQGVYACTYGVGCFHSTNGGYSFGSIASGGPSLINHISVDLRGNLWVADGTVWKYNGSSWSHVIASNSGYYSVAVDPDNVQHVFAVPAMGNMNVSTMGGEAGTWSGLSRGPSVTATDVPWLQSTAQGFMTIGQVVFDPSGNAPFSLYGAAGTGVFHLTPPISNVGRTNVNWISQTAGQETLVVNQIVAPPGVAPSAFVWDRSVFRLQNLGDGYGNRQTAFPSISPNVSWSADWATGAPSTLVMINTAAWSPTNELSGKSTDGGQTWERFAAFPKPGRGDDRHGTIAAGSATQFMIVPAGSDGPWYTSDAGKSWVQVRGLPNDGWGRSGTSILNVAADKVNSNIYYLLSDGPSDSGIYQCDGASCTKVYGGRVAAGTGLLHSVPGQAGHLFLNIVGKGVYFSSNGGRTWSAAVLSHGTTAFGNITAIGFGAALEEKSYPGVYLVGRDLKGAYAVWQCRNFKPGSPNSSTWNNLGYPLDSFNLIQWIDGDKSTPGLIYLATNGNGAISGYFP